MAPGFKRFTQKNRDNLERPFYPLFKKRYYGIIKEDFSIRIQRKNPLLRRKKIGPEL